ncbi:MAG: phage tail family protein [Anaerovoracaceae bacterium]
MEKLIYVNEKNNKAEFSSDSVFFAIEVSGISDINSNLYTNTSSGRPGETCSGNHIEPRGIEIEGIINTKGEQSKLNNRRYLTKILNPNLSGKLIYINENFVRVIDCKVTSPKFEEENKDIRFTIQIICPYPYWKEEYESRKDIANWMGAFEFDLEIPGEGIEMEYREPSLIVNVFNRGDVSVGAKVEFRSLGTVRGPKILNIDTGEFINFPDLEMKLGDVLMVNTHYGKKEATLYRDGVEEDMFRYIDIESSYINLQPGDNLFRYEAVENLELLEVAIYYNNEYLGV